MTIQADDKYAKRAVTLASLDIRRHLTASEIRSVIDERDFNVTFPETGRMKSAANQWLAAAHSAGFINITSAQVASLDVIRAMRNFLAHRSKSSKDTLQATLVVPALPADLKRGKNNIKDVGSYLESKPDPGKDARINLLLDEITVLAGKFCP